MTYPSNISEQSKAIRWCVIGSIICEYGAMQLDGAKHDLKHRANNVISWSRKVQDFFKFNPNTNAAFLDIFKKEFSKNEIIALAELLEACWCIDEDGLEYITNTIKKAQENAISEG